MNNPELLILDEPTKGFDPVNRRLLMNLIDAQKRLGSTVLMVTHQMEEVERLCDRIILLKDGVSRAYGTVEEVQNEFGNTLIHVEHQGRIPLADSYKIIQKSESNSTLEVANGTKLADILRRLVESGVNVSKFTPSRKSLDDIFVEIYGVDDLKEVE